MERLIKNIRDNKNSKIELKKVIKKVKKIANELNVEFTIEKTEVEERELSIFSHFTNDNYGERNPIYKNILLNVFDVTLTMDTEFKFSDGWSLVALVGHFEGFVIPLSGEKIPSKFIPSNTKCDHCNTKRYRRKSFIIKNDKNEFKQVGGGCLKKFLGINPEKYFRILNSYLNTPSSFEDLNDNGIEGRVWNSNLRAVDLDLIINMIDYQTKLDGKFIKNEWEDYTYIDYRGSEREGIKRSNQDESTPDKVSLSYSDIEKYNEVNIDLNQDIVNDFKEFLNNIDGFEEDKVYNSFESYLLSIKEFADVEVIKYKDISKVGSAYNYYLKQKDKKDQPVSNHMGVVGEKLPIIANIIHISSFATQYGMSNIYKMIDDKGNIFVKFGKINQRYSLEGDEIEKGSILKFKGVIKKHDTFNDNKQTIIGRCSKY